MQAGYCKNSGRNDSSPTQPCTFDPAPSDSGDVRLHPLDVRSQTLVLWMLSTHPDVGNSIMKFLIIFILSITRRL